MKTTAIFLFFAALVLAVDAKKAQKVKVVYVERVPPVPKQLSQYDLCKQECRVQRDAQTNQERVEQLKKELEEAESLLAEHNEHVDAPQVAETQEVTRNSVPTARKVSRYDHLKQAASELKSAVSGGSN